GQVFAGWYTSKEYARRVYTPATDGNRRYFAKYLPAVTLTFHQNNGKGDIVRGVAYNTSLGELIFPEREGYAFAGWFTSDNKPFSAYRNCTKHGEYYARWVEEEQAAEFMDNFGFLNEIPMLTINTEGGVGITSKFDYINANFIIESELNADWNVNVTTEIRGRGNSSWWCMAKPSYRIKLTDKNTNVLGMTGEKNYALISNHADKTMIRNLLAYGFGADEAYNQGWEPEFHYVYLTINGDFRGLYLLIETIRASKDRINLAGTPKNEYDTGFLLEQVPYNRMLEELERNPDEPYIYVAGTYYWNVKYPEREDFETEAEWDSVLTYITDVMSMAMRALYNGDRDTYLKYLDEDSFIDYWLMQDLFSNFDCTQASIFVYKKQGGLITAGPLWDFDIGINNVSYVDRAPDTWYGFQVNAAGAGLKKHPESRRKVYERIVEMYEGDWQLYLYSVFACMNEIEEGWNRNYERWDYNEKVFETPDWILALPNREAQYDFVFTWLAEKMNFLYQESKKGLASLN
ncbi:MAG: CotH kinase family protein, partial [Clostridia bacterium]|nr:CotH kinase family protein [Clostridia bacterium]